MTTFNHTVRLAAAMAVAAGTMAAGAAPLKVCTTTTDLGALVHEVGGEEVRITVFAGGMEDAHFVEARPSFIRELNGADLYVQVGLDLEVGWAPVLLRGARNARVQPGGPGYLDVSAAIQPRDIPEGPVDRSQGDVHALGNPHYLLDPINGLKVSRLIRDRLASLRPKRRAYFEKRYVDFRGRLGAALIGRELAEKYDVEKLMILHDHGRLDAFLEQEGDVALLGGWLGRLKHLNGAPVVADHNMWNYLAPRFGLQVIGYMEPRPGLTPTTRHLSSLVQTMRDRGVKLVIASPYFPDRHAAFLADHTGAVPVVLAHQVQAVADAADYLAVFETNLQRILREMRREEAP